MKFLKSELNTKHIWLHLRSELTPSLHKRLPRMTKFRPLSIAKARKTSVINQPPQHKLLKINMIYHVAKRRSILVMQTLMPW